MGAGYHGGFGHTKGSEKHKEKVQIPINGRRDIRYSERKIKDYLLNLNHPIGGTKAKFLQDVLGYNAQDSRLFYNNIVNAIVKRVPNETIKTEYGIKHVYNTKLVGKYSKSISVNIVVIVQKDKGRVTYKIVTVYPDHKEK